MWPSSWWIVIKSSWLILVHIFTLGRKISPYFEGYFWVSFHAIKVLMKIDFARSLRHMHLDEIIFHMGNGYKKVRGDLKLIRETQYE